MTEKRQLRDSKSQKCFIVNRYIHVAQFLEVFVDSSLEVCENRDPKGMYAKARKGEIKNFTGISSPYEAPLNPEIHVINNSITLDEASNQIISYLIDKEYINQ